MDRFASYRLTPANYVPNNMHFTKHPSTEPTLPLVAYNQANEPIGFTWSYGESVYLEFLTTGYVVYNEGEASDSAGFTEDAETYLSHKTPADYPKHGDNGVRLRSDTAVDATALVDGTTSTDDDEESSEQQDSQESSTETQAEEYFSDGTKIFQILVYNFRYDVVAWCEVPAATRVRVLSDSFYPHSLVKGVYKLQLNLIDKNAGTQITLLKGDECTLFIT